MSLIVALAVVTPGVILLALILVVAIRPSVSSALAEVLLASAAPLKAISPWHASRSWLTEPDDESAASQGETRVSNLEPRFLSRSAAGILMRFAMDEEGVVRYGAQLARELHIPTGSLYPCLKMLERQGWLRSELEDIEPSNLDRPPRRYYRLTEDGRAAAGEMVRKELDRFSSRGLVISYSEAAEAVARREITQVRFGDDPDLYTC